MVADLYLLTPTQIHKAITLKQIETNPVLAMLHNRNYIYERVFLIIVMNT